MTVANFDGSPASDNGDGTITVRNADGSTKIVYGPTFGTLAGATFSTSAPGADGSTITTYYMGKSTPTGATKTNADGTTASFDPRNGTTSTADASGHAAGVTDANGNPLTPSQIADLNNQTNGTIGNGGLLGLGGNPVSTAALGIGAAFKKITGTVSPDIPYQQTNTSGAQATVDQTKTTAQQLAQAAANTKSGAQAQADVTSAQAAYNAALQQQARAGVGTINATIAANAVASAKAALTQAQQVLATTPVAPTVTAVQTGPQSLASVPTAGPVAMATPGQVGGVMQVVAPTIGAAPTASGAGAGGAAAQGYDATGYLAQAGQAETQYLDTVPQAEFRGTQQSLIGSLQDTIAGKNPSVADLQLRDAEQRQEANQLGIAAAASGGGNSPLAMRTAANNVGMLNQAAASSGALLRAQEIANSQGLLGSAAEQARTGDITIADRNATLGTGTNVSNAGFLTQANIASAGNLTGASEASAQNKTGASIATARNATDASIASANNATAASIASANDATTLMAKQAELEYDASHDNAGNLLSAAETNAHLLSDANLANALALNTSALQTQKLATDVSQTNANNATTLNVNNTKFLNDANTTNASNFLTQEGLDNTKSNNATNNFLTANGQVIQGQGNILNAQTQANATNAGTARANQQNTLDTAKAGGTAAAWLFGGPAAGTVASGSGGGDVTMGANGSPIISDRRSKTDVSDGSGDAQNLLDALTSKSFRYKDPSKPGASPGRQTGVMAQDVEKAPAGRAFVRDTPTGKKLDPSAGFGTVLSMLAQLNDRMNKQEGRRAA